MPTIGYKQLPGKGWQSRRPYLFEVGEDGTFVRCESLWIASVLITHSKKWVDYKFSKDYPPGQFDGTLLGRIKASGEPVFVFVIRGDAESLWERKQLFHAGALWVPPAELEKSRNYLLDALAEARRQAELAEKNLPDVAR